jgi:hypothetical protein
MPVESRGRFRHAHAQHLSTRHDASPNDILHRATASFDGTLPDRLDRAKAAATQNGHLGHLPFLVRL